MSNGVSAFNIPSYMPGDLTPMTNQQVPINQPSLPGASPGGFGSLDFGEKLGLGVQGLSTVAGLVMGLKQLGLANKQFNFQKQFATTNLANSVKSYNTALSDRLRSRSVMETGSTNGSDAAIAANSLKTSY